MSSPRYSGWPSVAAGLKRQAVLFSEMDCQKNRKYCDAEVQHFFEALAPQLLGHCIEEATTRMGPFNACADNDRGRIWYEWRADSKTLVLETFNGGINGFELE